MNQEMNCFFLLSLLLNTPTLQISMSHILKRKENKFLLIALVVFAISAATFFFNLHRYSENVTENIAVERKITQIDKIYNNYLTSIIHKRGYQFGLDKESLDRFLAYNKTNQLLINEFSKEVTGPEMEKLYEELVHSNLDRRDLLARHIAYLDSMTQEAALSIIISENPEILKTSLALENAFANLKEYLEGESLELEETGEKLTLVNNVGFVILGLLVVGFITGTFIQTRKQTLLEAEKENQEEILRITRNSEIQFSTSFQNAAIGMALVSREGRFTAVNRSLCKLLGYSEEELVGLTFQEITHPDDLFTDLEYAQQLLDQKIESYSMEKRYFKKDGETVWINLNGTAVWNEDGSFRHFIAQIQNITPRKLAFEALQDQKNRFENVIRGTNAGTWEWNVQTGESVFNETWAEIIGYSLKELEPISIQTWADFAHPDDLERSNEILQKCFTGESEYYECECRMRHRDGHWVWVLDRGKVMSWTYDGKPEKMFGTHIDISKFKSLEDILLQKEAFINAMLDTLDVGIVVCDEKGELKLFNRATLALHGLDSKNIPQDEWSRHYHLLKEDGQTFLETEEVPLYRAWKGEWVENQIICIRHTSGEVYYVSASGSQIRDELGNIQGAVVAMKNITESRKIGLELEERERKFKGIFNSTFQFIGFLDPDGTLVEANQTAMDFAGLKPADVVGKKFWDCYWWQISTETQEKLRSAIHQAAQGEFIQYEVAVWDKEKNPVTILFNLKPLFDAAGEVTAIIPEGRLVQEIVDARKSLEEKNKELERFASVASHDLKEPLRMIVSFLQLLERKYKGQLDEKADQYIHFAVDAAQRMNILISDLLDFSKVGNENTTKEEIDLNLIIKDQEGYFSQLLNESGGTLDFASLPIITGKKVPISLLFRNLIANAIKYRKPDLPPKITIEGKDCVDHWELSVTDNGIGVDSEYREVIFEMFKRLHTKQEYPGTGLGLAVCKKIVEQHNGKIWVESNPGSGSSFHFTLRKS